jgi:hypothetical protein
VVVPESLIIAVVEEPAPSAGPEDVQAPPVLRGNLVITIRQTGDPESDLTLMRSVLAAIKERPGRDIINLNIANNGTVTPMKLRGVDAGDELQQKLAELVGGSSLTVGREVST